ncbi:MAG: tetratricopeptide repeat protein [Gammaproteobacteria bacterium]|nr:tetratricopeptide repeat protein [Gammaproteobacteria bacterium]
MEAYIFEVSKSSFNSSVILNSYKIPIIVEFMGVWSGPCIEMSDQLARLATEFAGKFVFAKVDVDEQAELSEEYGVQNVPTILVIRNGEVIRREEGLLAEEQLRDILEAVDVFRDSDKLREQARIKHMAGETIEAISLLTTAIKQDPSNSRVAMDMAQILIDIGELVQARELFNRLPDTVKQTDQGRTLVAQIAFKEQAAKTEGELALRARLELDSQDYDACFDLAICRVAEHDYKEASELLLLIVEREPTHKDGAAHELLISLSNMLSTNEPDLSQSIRRKLGNVLAS